MAELKLEPMEFAEHKEQTAKDVEGFAEELRELAVAIREGDLGRFEKFIFEDDEGPKIHKWQELMALRYLVRQERVDLGSKK